VRPRADDLVDLACLAADARELLALVVLIAHLGRGRGRGRRRRRRGVRGSVRVRARASVKSPGWGQGSWRPLAAHLVELAVGAGALAAPAARVRRVLDDLVEARGVDARDAAVRPRAAPLVELARLAAVARERAAVFLGARRVPLQVAHLGRVRVRVRVRV